MTRKNPAFKGYRPSLPGPTVKHHKRRNMQRIVS